MSGSSDFLIDPGPSFAESIVALRKATYGRNDKKGIEQLDEAIEAMLEKLFNWPHVAGLRPEPFPAKVASNIEGWTLHKLEFSCPRANGAQRQGRLVILTNLTERLIRPVYIYTHAQFPGRIPDGSLRDLVLKAARSSPSIPIPTPPGSTPTPLESTATGSDEKARVKSKPTLNTGPIPVVSATIVEQGESKVPATIDPSKNSDPER